MGLMDRFRGGDDDEAAERPHPVREVRELVRNGYSEDDITDVLRDEGYTYDQINRALNTVVRESTVQTGREQAQQEGVDAPPAPPAQGGQGQGQQAYRDEAYEQPAQQPRQQQREYDQPAGEQYLPQGRDFRAERTAEAPQPPREEYDELEYERGPQDRDGSEQEELIEIIVAEQVADIEDDLDLLFDQVDVLQDQLQSIESGLEGHSESEESAVQEVFNRLERVEDELSQMQSRADGMERALQQVLPNLVDNIRDLKRIIKDRNL